MRYGYWLPVFGGWLRNVADEKMQASWAYVKRLAQRSEELGFDVTLIAELNLNDIKGVEAPSLDAWSTAAALAAVTERIELMVAVRPTFHLPALLAKQAANIDHFSGGRLSLGRRGAQVWRRFRAARRPLRTHRRMARCTERRLVARPFLICRKILSGRGQCPGAKAGVATAADTVCRRRVACCEGTDRREM
jgi:alkanesulfonate monooxygenase SsuD/methylene tetrahydromethanopterin reductase-like flavin-dependent oxidoreductase (luciferase family)